MELQKNKKKEKQQIGEKVQNYCAGHQKCTSGCRPLVIVSLRSLTGSDL
jgi:hypothetical protein